MQIKKIIALIVIAFGVFFTGMVLFSIWFPSIMINNSPVSKLIPTTGVISAAFLALLAVLKLIEPKQ